MNFNCLIIFITLYISLFSQSGIIKPNSSNNSATIFGNVIGPNGAISDATIIVTNQDVTDIYGETYSYPKSGESIGYFSITHLPTDIQLIVYVFHENIPNILGASAVRLKNKEVKRISLSLNIRDNSPENSADNKHVSSLDLFTLFTKYALIWEKNVKGNQSRNTLDKLKNLAYNSNSKNNSQFTKERLIKVKGGGGRATFTNIEFVLEKEMKIIAAYGYSDASDGNVRAGFSFDNNNWYDVGDKKWHNYDFITKRFFIKLDSKWGADKDSYIEIKLLSPENSVNTDIRYIHLDKNNDDLEFININ